MADLYSSDLGSNARKTFASTKFGTRELSYHQIDMGTDVTTGYTAANSLYYKAVRALQEQVEIYSVGEPSGDWFTVAIAADTCPFPANRSNGDGNTNVRLRDIIDAACGTSCRVFNSKILGNNLWNDC